MTGGHIDEEIQRTRAVVEQIQKLKDALSQRMKTEREMHDRLDALAEWNMKKMDLLRTLGPHLSDTEKFSDTWFSLLYEQDIKMEEILACMADELSKTRYLLSQWHLTTVSSQIWMYGSTEALRKDIQQRGVAGAEARHAEDITAKIVYDIAVFLEKMFSTNLAKEFRDIVASWRTCGDAQKPDLLEKFSTMIFDTLLGTWGATGKQLAKTTWYQRYKSMEYKEPFLRARFFMLGHIDENELKHSALLDIDAVAYGMRACYRRISESDLEQKDTAFLDGLFFALLSQVARLLLMRNHHYKRLP